MILALDTTLGACSVAIGERESGVLGFEYHERARGHAEAIVPMIERVVAKAGRSRTEISGIACTTGPGSFTGVRVGLAAAKGLALGLGVRLAGIPTLEALAASLLFDDPSSGTEDGRVLAVIDGPRGGFIAQAFTIDPAKVRVEPVAEIEGVSEDQASNMDFKAIAFTVGPAAQRLADMAGGTAAKAIVRQADARVICRYVFAATEDRWQENLSPIYFRPPHAVPAKPPPWIKPGARLS